MTNNIINLDDYFPDISLFLPEPVVIEPAYEPDDFGGAA